MSSIIDINCPDNAAGRFLSEERDWKNWWPGEVADSAGTPSFSYLGTRFQPAEKAFNGTRLRTSFGDSIITGSLVHAKSSLDSIVAVWQYGVHTSTNPVIRLRQYLALKELKKKTDTILVALKTFLEKKENVYGIDIREIRVTDTLLISKFITSPQPPSMETVYSQIDQLKQAIAAAGAQETGFPMLNVSRINEGLYKTRVAIPINKEITPSATNEIKKMVPGRILVSEVKGGQAVIDKAYRQFRNYLSDYDLASPAIPFESLVTKRIPVKDSAAWITRIYYPIL